MSRRKSRLGGHRNNLGSKQYRHRIYINDGQFVKAGTIIIIGNTNKFKLGINTYYGKNHTIHAKIEGTVKIKNKKVNVYEKEM